MIEIILLVWLVLGIITFVVGAFGTLVIMSEIQQQGYADKDNRRGLRVGFMIMGTGLFLPLVIPAAALYGLSLALIRFAQAGRLAFARQVEEIE